MTLVELNGKVTENGFLVFDCPVCKDHKIRVPLSPTVDRNGRSWQHSGEFPKLTLSPSVNAGCWHGNITDGDCSLGS